VKRANREKVLAAVLDPTVQQLQLNSQKKKEAGDFLEF
jgi:hypothetical protein